MTDPRLHSSSLPSLSLLHLTAPPLHGPQQLLHSGLYLARRGLTGKAGFKRRQLIGDLTVQCGRAGAVGKPYGLRQALQRCCVVPVGRRARQGPDPALQGLERGERLLLGGLGRPCTPPEGGEDLISL